MTAPLAFMEFVKLISPERMKNIWFVPLRTKSKMPEISIGDKIKENEKKYRLSPSSSYHRLKNGQNIGIYALPGGLMFLDLDVRDGKLLASAEFLDALAPTLTVRSRNGGIQKYYLNDGEYRNQLLYENDKIIGELRTNWQYVVSVGSYVPQDDNNAGGDGYYRIVEHLSIRTFCGCPGVEKEIGEETEKKQETKKDDSKWKHNEKNCFSQEDHDRMLRETGKKRGDRIYYKEVI